MINYRMLEKKDVNLFLTLRIKMLSEDSNQEYDIELLKHLTTDYFNKFINNNLFIFGAFENEKLLSIAGYEILNRLPTPMLNNLNSDIAYVCSVYTVPDYRKKGLSKKLMELLIKDAKSKKISRFKLSTHNEIAKKMYENFGFVKDESMMKLYVK